MIKSSHRAARLSILAALGWILASPVAASNGYSGRWIVSDDKPVFSSRGLFYKTVDIAPCGKDFCGVSVGSSGACGPMLFRFFAKSMRSGDTLSGHGRWGELRKNIEIYQYADKAAPGGRILGVNLGDGHDFGERSGNMPKFSATYRPLGAAHCVVR
jgi:hypothetical protein